MRINRTQTVEFILSLSPDGMGRAREIKIPSWSVETLKITHEEARAMQDGLDALQDRNRNKPDR